MVVTVCSYHCGSSGGGIDCIASVVVGIVMVILLLLLLLLLPISMVGVITSVGMYTSTALGSQKE